MLDRSSRRLTVVQVLIVSLVVTLLGRLWYLQVDVGPSLKALAANDQIRVVSTPAVRGMILDDMGRPLAQNQTSLVVSVSLTALSSQPDGGTAVLKRVAATLGVPYSSILARTTLCGQPGSVAGVCWTGSPYQPVPISTNANQAAALQIMQEQSRYPGVTAELQAVRQYPQPYGVQAAHLLGYVGPVSASELAAQSAAGRSNAPNALQAGQLVGRSGLEQQYDTALRGTPGATKLEVNSAGSVVSTMSTTPAVPGNYLVTSIDARVQAAAQQALAAAIQRARNMTNITGGPGATYRAPAGAVVVMDVHTGRIVAMSSYPSYNPYVWVGGISQANYNALTSPANHEPLLNRAIAGQYPTGSVFKIVTISAAGKSGFNLHGSYDCMPSITLGGRQFGNYHNESFGMISLQEATQVSCDTVFYQLGYQMWLNAGGTNGTDAKDALVQMSDAYGLGQPTGIDLPGEAPGRVPSRAWRLAFWKAIRGPYCAALKTAPTNFTDQYYCRYDGQYLPGDELNFAVGQGDFLATPLQMARAYAAVANGGTLYVPQLAKAIVTPSGTVVKTFAPKVAGHIPVSPSVIQYLQQILPTVTTSPLGTGYLPFANWPFSQITVATKTGTAQVSGKQTQSWFASYAGPVGHPQYAIVMTVQQGGTGELTSGPSVRAIYDALYGVSSAGTWNPKASVLPNDQLPRELPVVAADGQIYPPGTVLPRSQTSPAPAVSPSAPPLPVQGSLALAWAVPPDTRRYPPGTGPGSTRAL
ncbi:MAG: penicillin-binding protein 2 [Actinomycetes bacterium]